MSASRLQSSLALLLLAALLIFGSIPQLPGMAQQGRDSGIFAYTGHVILEGGLPFVDAWDNKPPGVYYINALAFLLFGTDRLALWIIELIFNAATALIFYRLLLGIIEQEKAALIGAAIFTLLMRHPAFVGGGNFTESYALLPQVAGLAVGYHFLRKPTLKSAFCFGALGGLAFLIKPTTIGITLALVPAIFFTGLHQRGKFAAHLAAMIGGGLAILGAVSGYLLAEGIFSEAYRAAIISPEKLHSWISEEPVAPWETVISTFLRGEGFHATILPMVPFVIIAVYQVIVRRAELPPLRRALFLWTGLAFLLDLLMANLSNRGYYHYYQTPMPAALLPTLILVLTSEQPRRWTPRYLALIGAAAAIAILGFIIIREGEPFRASLNDPLTEYVVSHTQPDEKVLVWGASTQLNFQSGRASPTQFTYGYPLVVPDYTTQSDIDDFLGDLERQQPSMIVDRTFMDNTRVPPLDAERRAIWYEEESGRRDTFDLSPIFDFVAAHCDITEEIERDVIYWCDF